MKLESGNKRGIFSLLILSFCLAPGIKAQNFNLPVLDGFRRELNYPVYSPDDLWDYIDGAAESYNALGFNELYIAEYIKGKKNIIKLEVYNHLNNNLAFGIYALERAPGYYFNSLGVQGYSGEDHIHFYKGNYYIKISTHSKSKKAHDGMNKLAGLIDNLIEGRGGFPETLELFPSEGRRLNEEMYIADNVLGHEFLQQSFKVSYEIDNKRFDIYFFNEGGADAIAGMAEKYLNRLDLGTGLRTEGKVFFKDGYNGQVFLAWKDDVMVLINGLGESENELADRLIENFIK